MNSDAHAVQQRLSSHALLMRTRHCRCAEIAVSQWSEYGQQPLSTSKVRASIKQIRGDDGFQMGNRMLFMQSHKADSEHHWERTLLR
jgi:hypothetical protein